MRWLDRRWSGTAIIVGGAANLLLGLVFLGEVALPWSEGLRNLWLVGPSLLMFLGIPGLAATFQPRSPPSAGSALLVVAVGLLLQFFVRLADLVLGDDRSGFGVPPMLSFPGWFGTLAVAIGFLVLGGMLWNEERLSPWRRIFVALGAAMILSFLGVFPYLSLVLFLGMVVAAGWIAVGVLTATDRWAAAAGPRQSS